MLLDQDCIHTSNGWESHNFVGDSNELLKFSWEIFLPYFWEDFLHVWQSRGNDVDACKYFVENKALLFVENLLQQNEKQLTDFYGIPLPNWPM